LNALENMMTDTKSWYLSRTVWASVVTILLSVAGLVGVSIDAINPEGLTDALLQAATVIAGIVAIVGRLAATRKIS
jgi:hypothetical protein